MTTSPIAPPKHRDPNRDVHRKVVGKRDRVLLLSCGHDHPVGAVNDLPEPWRACRVCRFPREVG